MHRRSCIKPNVLLSLLIISFFALPETHIVNSQSSTEIVTPKDIRDYLSEFFKVFNKQLEFRFGLNSSSYFENLYYKIYVTISTTHGVAIEFFPSNKSEAYFIITEKRIKTAVFPDLKFKITPPNLDSTIFTWTGKPNETMFDVGNSTDVILKNLIIVTNKGQFIKLGSKGEVYLYDITVDGRYYHALILRGSNTKDCWTRDNAKKDAEELLKYKSFYGFKQAETIKEYMAYPVFVELLSPILWKQYNAKDIGYTLIQFENEMNEIRRLAVDTYHLDRNYADRIYAWLEKITPKPIELPEPPWYEVPPWSWILGWMVGVILTSILAYIRSRLIKTIKRT